MDVYIAQSEERGPLFRSPEDALIVFMNPDDAQRAAENMEEPGAAAKIDSEYVAERLRETGRERVMIVLDKDEAYVISVEAFERLMSNVQANVEKADKEEKERRAYQFIGDLLEEGFFEYDIETDMLRRTDKPLE
jgi:hypothetical protein